MSIFELSDYFRSFGMIGDNFINVFSEEVQENISKEFKRLKDLCYLDHAGATLYSEQQMRAVADDLCSNIYGNPHSLSTSSRYATDVVDQARYRVLRHFNASPEEYSVIFTSGATGALKLLAESFDWTGTNSGSNAPHLKERDDSDDEQRNGDDSPAEIQDSEYDGSAGTFVYLQDNHTSVLGMREIAAERGAAVRCVAHDEAFEIFSANMENEESNLVWRGNSLFAYPAQCNFSGIKYPLTWIDKVRNGALDREGRSRWFSVLDAAALVGTSPLDLSASAPDFVCISFYKMFGYPTGLGALLVRRGSADTLYRVYFGGGTVSISLSSERFHVPRPVLHERFEDGTISFLSVLSLRHGFESLQRLAGDMFAVSHHCLSLARHVHHHLTTLHHANGAPAATVYADTDYQDVRTQGGVVNFNLLRGDGQTIGFVEVLNMANLYDIQLRTGCFCNPGACQRHLNLSEQDLRSHFQAGHVCGDERDLIDGRPTGSVRVSFGFMSTKSDADRLLTMISACFVTGQPKFRLPHSWFAFQKAYSDKFQDAIGLKDLSRGNDAADKNIFANQGNMWSDLENAPINKSTDKDTAKTHMNNGVTNSVIGREGEHNGTDSISENKTHNINPPGQVRLETIFVYPVKSCGAVSVSHWNLGERGLVFDREWMIVTAAGSALTQKTEPKLSLIAPAINLQRQTLSLHFPGMESLSLPLRAPTFAPTDKGSLCDSKVCGDRVQGWDCGESAARWLNHALHREGLRLIRQWGRDPKKPREGALSLSNQAQYLLLSAESVAWLAERLPLEADRNPANLTLRFRGNLVVRGTQPFAEYDWQEATIGGTVFKSQGPCRRCQVICVDQVTGEKTREPLTTIAAMGQTRFGAYFARAPHAGIGTIAVGDVVTTTVASVQIT